MRYASCLAWLMLMPCSCLCGPKKRVDLDASPPLSVTPPSSYKADSPLIDEEDIEDILSKAMENLGLHPSESTDHQFTLLEEDQDTEPHKPTESFTKESTEDNCEPGRPTKKARRDVDSALCPS